MDNLINNNISNESLNNENKLITEYVETGEGLGISIISLKEKEKNIDEKNLLLLNNNDNILL